MMQYSLSLPSLLSLCATAAAGTALITPAITAYLLEKNILDIPRKGSGHTTPRPRGGGLGIAAIISVMFAVLAYSLPVPLHFKAMLGGFLLLVGVSWWDDRADLGYKLRLFMQFIAILPAACTFGPDFLIFQGVLPLIADRIILVIAWLWFTNIMNLMDGIDGITAMEGAFIGGAVAILLLLTGTGPAWLPAAALIIAGACLGFLIWNWQPARVFMGDVGTIPLGFICGWLLMNMAAEGLLLSAMLIPLYHCYDASLTLFLRLSMRRTLIARHRSHFFQRAIRAGYTHAQTVLMLLVVNMCLFACAAVAANMRNSMLDVLAILLGVLTMGVVTWHFMRLAPIPRDQL